MNETLKNEKGVVLVIALMMIVILSLVSMATVQSSIFEIKLAGNQYLKTQAFQSSESGWQVTRTKLETLDTNPTSPTWTVTETLNDPIRYKAVVTHVLNTDGTVKTMAGKPVYRIHSDGYQQESNQVTEVVVVLRPALDPPAALWSRASVDVKGSSTYVNGKDGCGGIGTDKPGIETRGTVTQSGSPILDGAPVTNENISTNYPIEDTIAYLKGYANVSENYTSSKTLTGQVFGDVQEGSTPQDPITPLTDPKIIYYNMNGTGIELTLNGAEGTGILLVDGSLKVGGTFQWYGIIIVTGTITFSGGGEKNITGGVISGGTPNVDATVGGNMSIVYCGNVKDYLKGKVPSTKILSWQHIF